MKINPSTKEIFTDTGEFIKRLHCPIHVKWNAMKKNGDRSKICVKCNKTIYDTANLNDTDILKLIKNDPQACLRVNLNQDNVKIVH
jgi:hypothetical protein|tara:strand:- start:622 stop:879 length:258 start_codon:yes stop_codon:yes gene_type:complete